MAGRPAGPGADFLQLRRGAAPAKGLTDWLVRALRSAIGDGRLGDGALLPPTRVLAGELDVSRGVVVEAYRRLAEQGLVTARTAYGTVVTASGSRSSAGRPRPPRRLAPEGFLPRLPGATAHMIDIDLSPGLPDLSAFPRAAWLRAERAVLLTPAHQFPTGVVLGPARRGALLDWARRGGLVIEDDYDAEYRYDRAPVPALQASAPEHVAHTGSISKTMAPGMRIGWLIAPRELQEDLVMAKYAHDLGSPVLPQLVLAELLAKGEIDRHIRLTRVRYRARRDAFVETLRRAWPAARIQGVAAGLHVMVGLPERGRDLDDVELATRLAEAGVLTQPLSWHRIGPGPPGLVVGYAANSPDRLRAAACRIAEVARGG